MQIRQLQVAHDRAEDRLVLRVSNQANEEFRVFLTRILLRDLWPCLSSLLQQQPAAPIGETPPQGANNTSNFDQPFAEDRATYPLGMRPLLVSEVSITPLPENVFRMVFKEARERTFNLNLTADLLQALCAMLRASSQAARWDLVLEYVTGATSPPAPVGHVDELVAPSHTLKRSLLH